MGFAGSQKKNSLALEARRWVTSIPRVVQAGRWPNGAFGCACLLFVCIETDLELGAGAALTALLLVLAKFAADSICCGGFLSRYFSWDISKAVYSCLDFEHLPVPPLRDLVNCSMAAYWRFNV